MYLRKEKAKCIIQSFENETLKCLANDIQSMKFLAHEIETCKTEPILFSLLNSLYQKAMKMQVYYYNIEYDIDNEGIVYQINKLIEDNQNFFEKVRDILVRNNLIEAIDDEDK